MSLLSQALTHRDEIYQSPKVVDQKFIEECELAIAYFDGKVYAGQVAKVLGYSKTAQVGSWASSVVMKGIRAKMVRLEMSKPEEHSLSGLPDGAGVEK